MKLRELFPEAVMNRQPQMGPEWLTLEFGDQFVHFPQHKLSPRERILLTMQQQAVLVEEEADVWHQYLLQKKGQIPQKLDAAQLLYVEHATRLSPDLLELFRDLLPNLLAVVEASSTRTVLVLHQEPRLEVAALVQDVLPTVENDFDTKLTIFFGNSWTRLQQEDLRHLFDSEYQLFSDFVRLKGNEQTISFSSMILWAQSRQLDLAAISEKIRHYIDDSKDISDIIEALWQSQGNLVQTAQKLFMHRNSLQYKLDKFHNLSGLNLKNLDDLAFCRLLMLHD